MVMGYEDVRTVDTGLVLGLGYGGSCSGAASGAARPPDVELVKQVSSSLRGADSMETSLTLGRQFLAEGMAVKKPEAAEEQRNGRPSSPQSMTSSLSNNLPSANVKRSERDAAGEDVVDAERAMSSRASDEDEDASAKKKLRLSKEQSALLEERFKEHSTLNPKQKMALAKQLNLRPRQVEVWFQNRRARTKLKQTEADCQFLKRCCESLTDENRRLQKELQQLKALKFATPLYMQMAGAATLTLCPSCEKINRVDAGDNSNKEASTIVDVAPKPHLYGSLSRSSSSAAC